MKTILLNLYYDGYTIEQSINFCKRCYGLEPSENMIEKVKKEIKKFRNQEWN